MKINKLTKLLILIFGISLFFFSSCEKDNNFDENISTIQKSNVIAKRVALNKIKENQTLKQSLDKIEKHFNYIKKSNEFSKINSTDNTFSILTDEIIQVNTDSTEAYTFRIETPTHSDSAFENFVIEKRNNGNYKFYIYRYKRLELEENIEITYSMSKDLVSTNQINIGDFQDIVNAKMLYDPKSGCVFNITWDDDCYCEYAEVLWCDPEEGGGGSPEGGNDGASPGGYSSEGYHSGSTSSGGSTIGVLPNPLDIAIDNFFDNLTDEEIDCINNNYSLEKQIRKFLEENMQLISNINGSSNTNTQDFVIQAIEDICNPSNDINNLSEYIASEIDSLTNSNPFLLLEIDCNQIQNWQTLAQHTAPQSVQDKINNLPSNWANDFEIQSIQNANGTIVNLDYFSVNVSLLPNNPSTNQQFTADEFLDYIRRNFNDFVDGSTFEPYCEISSMCQTETDLWNSNNPLGSIIYIDIPGDDGVVVCTEYTNSYWYFMTMNTPYAGNHPVSGTRQFGYELNTNGSYNFFVRGVDRFNSNIVENSLYVVTFGNPFLGADALWVSFQEKLNSFINNPINGGNSTIVSPIKNRPDWNKVQEVLNGQRPISDLGCN